MSTFPPPVSAPTGSDPTAVMGRRIGAYVIDVLIGWAVMAAVFWSVSETVPNSPFLSCAGDGAPTLCFEFGDTIRFAEGNDATLVSVAGLALWAVMGIVIQGLTGGTPGKLMVGLRVVRQDDGQLAGFGRSAARTGLWLVDAFPYIFPLVGLITAVSTKGNRRVGDMAAGTLVVRADAVGTPPFVPGLTATVATPYAPPGGQGSWTPPTAPPAAAPPPADLADPFAQPTGEVFPTPDRFPSGPSTEALPPPVAPPTPPDDQPQWDAQRNTYVWFDRANGHWLAHDAATDQWRPI